MISKKLGPKVLLVEKNNHLSKILDSCSIYHNVNVDRLKSIDSVPPLALNKYNLLIIDIDLTLESNAFTIRQIRKHNLFLPIIAIGPDNQTQEIQSCNLEINIYHHKPINCELLKAQIIQLTSFFHKQVILKVGDIRIDLATRSLITHSKKIIFTCQEFHLLLLLIKAEGRILNKNKICDYLSGSNKDVSCAALDTLVSRIRSKLKLYLEKPFIKTAYKLGYRINPVYTKDYHVEKV